ncbi:MAG: hypothetical protein ACRD3T_00025 [Terriglobia bacterium]
MRKRIRFAPLLLIVAASFAVWAEHTHSRSLGIAAGVFLFTVGVYVLALSAIRLAFREQGRSKILLLSAGLFLGGVVLAGWISLRHSAGLDPVLLVIMLACTTFPVMLYGLVLAAARQVIKERQCVETG